MTTRFKDFGDGGYTAAEPVSFQLYGEIFECQSAIQGTTLLDMVAMAGSTNASESASVLTDFFSKVLLPESKERFDALLRSPDRIVRIETLGEITTWLVSEYSNRPQQGLEHSQSGQ